MSADYYVDITYEHGVREMQAIYGGYIKGYNSGEMDVGARKMVVHYPGKKREGDYVLTVSGKVMKHSDVCLLIANLVLGGFFTVFYV